MALIVLSHFFTGAKHTSTAADHNNDNNENNEHRDDDDSSDSSHSSDDSDEEEEEEEDRVIKSFSQSTQEAGDPPVAF